MGLIRKAYAQLYINEFNQSKTKKSKHNKNNCLVQNPFHKNCIAHNNRIHFAPEALCLALFTWSFFSLQFSAFCSHERTTFFSSTYCHHVNNNISQLMLVYHHNRLKWKEWNKHCIFILMMMATIINWKFIWFQFS